MKNILKLLLPAFPPLMSRFTRPKPFGARR